MAKFQILKTNSKEYYFHLRATRNHEIILRGDNFTSKIACEIDIAAVKRSAPDDARYERLVSENSQYYFKLKAADSAVIGTSQTYISTSSREKAIALVKTQAPSAWIEDLT